MMINDRTAIICPKCKQTLTVELKQCECCKKEMCYFCLREHHSIRLMRRVHAIESQGYQVPQKLIKEYERIIQDRSVF